MASPGIRDLAQALDAKNLASPRPVFRDVYIRNIHLRVLTIPLRAGERPVGVLQAATNLGLVDSIRGSLLSILVSLTALSVLLAAAA